MPAPHPLTNDPAAYQLAEASAESHSSKLNKLRAAVLGANDGIVSTAGLVVGVAGATTDAGTIFMAGIAGLTAGALSMAVGEYVSVSAQRDTEAALIEKERRELAEMPEEELRELAGLYELKGLTPELALEVAVQLHAHDALGAHAETELGIDPNELTSAWAAAISSAIAFTLGALLPLLAIVLAPAETRIAITVVAVVTALALTGFASAKVSETRWLPAVARNVVGGLLAMGVTFTIGRLVGVAV